VAADRAGRRRGDGLRLYPTGAAGAHADQSRLRRPPTRRSRHAGRPAAFRAGPRHHRARGGLQATDTQNSRRSWRGTARSSFFGATTPSPGTCPRSYSSATFRPLIGRGRAGAEGAWTTRLAPASRGPCRGRPAIRNPAPTVPNKGVRPRIAGPCRRRAGPRRSPARRTPPEMPRNRTSSPLAASPAFPRTAVLPKTGVELPRNRDQCGDDLVGPAP